MTTTRFGIDGGILPQIEFESITKLGINGVIDNNIGEFSEKTEITNIINITPLNISITTNTINVNAAAGINVAPVNVSITPINVIVVVPTTITSVVSSRGADIATANETVTISVDDSTGITSVTINGVSCSNISLPTGTSVTCTCPLGFNTPYGSVVDVVVNNGIASPGYAVTVEPPSGMVETDFTVAYASLDPDSPFANNINFSELVAGDSCIYDAVTTPSSNALSMDGLGEFTVTGMTEQQVFNYYIFDASDNTVSPTIEQITILISDVQNVDISPVTVGITTYNVNVTTGTAETSVDISPVTVGITTYNVNVTTETSVDISPVTVGITTYNVNVTTGAIVVIETDIVVYGSTVMADDDSILNIGGDIDITKRVVFTDIAPVGRIKIVSDAADITQTVTVHGRDQAGVLVSEVLVLNGLTVVNGNQSFERILKIVVNATHVGSITVSEFTSSEVLVIMEPTVLEIRRPFYNAVSNATGGSDKTYYEKIFVKNNNTVSALTNATISEISDPLNKVTFGLALTLDDTGNNGAFNRLTAPGGITFNNLEKDVANSKTHSPNTAQGIWLAFTLLGGDVAVKSSFILRETGETT